MTSDFRVLLRQLILELAQRLPEVMTYREIANLFYKYGVIPNPEDPWGHYETKRAYVLEKLNAAEDLTLFLRDGIAELTEYASTGIEEAVNDTTMRRILRNMGYEDVDTDEEHGLSLSRAPDDLENKLGTSPSLATLDRIDPTGLPTSLITLIGELNDNLSRKNLNASALLLRRIITVACVIAMSKKGENDLLVDENGESLELGAILANCQRSYKLPNQVISRVRGVKWIGDSANHSYRVRITESDVESSVTAVRLFLDELDLRG